MLQSAFTAPKFNATVGDALRELDGVLLKIDFEKAYDKVSWSFLQQAMRMKGFDPKWCRWIHDFISRGSVGIRVNEDTGHNFQTKRGFDKAIFYLLFCLKLSLICY
jgi:hypothetical protein